MTDASVSPDDLRGASDDHAARGTGPPPPIGTGAIDVADLDRRLPNVDGVGVLRLLVRDGDTPLGWVTIQLQGVEVSPERLRAVVVDRLGLQLRAAALRRGDAHHGRAEAKEPAAPISVVVCTRDRDESLAHCLRSLLALDYENFEIVVVDNASSSDATARLVASMAVSLPEGRPTPSLRYVREHRPGLDWARNRGIDEAAHEIIAFTDDDARADRHWLAAIARAFADPAAVLVTGLVAPHELDTEAQRLFEDGYGGMGKGLVPQVWRGRADESATLLGAHHLGVGANMSFRRPIFREVGVFDTALDVGTPARGGGDLEMFHRVLASGALIRYEPSALVWHSHRRDHRALERQLRDNGRAFGVYLLTCARRGSVPVDDVARYAARVCLYWMRGLARALIGRDALSARMRAAELSGALAAPLAYYWSRSNDKALRQRPDAR